MSRTLPEIPTPNGAKRAELERTPAESAASLLRPKTLWLFRALLLIVSCAITLLLSPFALRGWLAALLGASVAVSLVLLEHFLRATPTASLLGAALGGLAGALAALLVASVIARTAIKEPDRSVLLCFALLGLVYCGVMLGLRQSQLLAIGSMPSILRAHPHSAKLKGKLLDTSVLIDGRIADICEAQFLDGPLLVPQFVLHELQSIADSSDTLRRQRGRRGLDVLDRMRKMQHLEIRVLEDSSSISGEVDRRLIELAQRLEAKIVTNDFNLNKVASVQGIGVLNINLLANAVRPAVLPGENMRVFILREGKEVNQGVAYLEDGTMVVVDGARRLINKTVDICVTSVHQTPAGKMIFGRLDERSETPIPASRHAAAGRMARPPVPDSET
jgi:uncharacterized protein YacL